MNDMRMHVLKYFLVFPGVRNKYTARFHASIASKFALTAIVWQFS